MFKVECFIGGSWMFFSNEQSQEAANSTVAILISSCITARVVNPICLSAL